MAGSRETEVAWPLAGQLPSDSEETFEPEWTVESAATAGAGTRSWAEELLTPFASAITGQVAETEGGAVNGEPFRAEQPEVEEPETELPEAEPYETEVFEAEEFARHADFAVIGYPGAPEAEAEPPSGFSVEGELESWATALARLPEQVRSALREGEGAVALRLLVGTGVRDENRLANLVFHSRHPELGGRSIRQDETALVTEWLTIRRDLVRPLVRQQPAGDVSTGASTATPVGAGYRSTRYLQQAWREDECRNGGMMIISVLGHKLQINSRAEQAFAALGHALEQASYQARVVGGYCCRNIAGYKTRSLHSYGIAIDIDPAWNPNIPTPDRRGVRFSTAPTRQERLAEVRRGEADTVFTPQQIAAVEDIRTVAGLQVFVWGGRWQTTKDTMHFQLNVTPEELVRGLVL